MIVCHCNCISDKAFKKAASICPHDNTEKPKSEFCHLKKIYNKASGGKKPACYGCAPLIRKIVA